MLSIWNKKNKKKTNLNLKKNKFNSCDIAITNISNIFRTENCGKFRCVQYVVYGCEPSKLNLEFFNIVAPDRQISGPILTKFSNLGLYHYTNPQPNNSLSVWDSYRNSSDELEAVSFRTRRETWGRKLNSESTVDKQMNGIAISINAESW